MKKFPPAAGQEWGKYDMIENRSPGEKAGNIISDEGNCFMEEMRKKGNVIALLPIGVFLVLYLGLGILFEYVMKIPMGFYNVPIVVAFLAAILVACVQNRTISFDRKLELMAKGVGDKNIITMLLIFLTAGSFVGVVGRSSAESVAYCMLSLIPARFFRCGTVCSCLLCICGDGNLRWDYHASYPYCGSSFQSLRF